MSPGYTKGNAGYVVEFLYKLPDGPQKGTWTEARAVFPDESGVDHFLAAEVGKMGLMHVSVRPREDRHLVKSIAVEAA